MLPLRQLACERLKTTLLLSDYTRCELTLIFLLFCNASDCAIGFVQRGLALAHALRPWYDTRYTICGLTDTPNLVRGMDDELAAYFASQPFHRCVLLSCRPRCATRQLTPEWSR